MAFSAGERYSYLSSLGFSCLFGAAFLRSGRATRALAAAWLCALGFMSWRQCAVWRDSVTLWSSAVDRAPGDFARTSLGVSLITAGRFQDGLRTLENAAALRPFTPLVYENLGVALHKDGNEAGARSAWRQGLEINPSAELHAHLGASLATGDAADLTEGLEHLQAAVSAYPRCALCRLDLGAALGRAGDVPGAEAQYAAALELEPRLSGAHNDWGLLLAGSGARDEALRHYRAELYLTGARAQAHYNWGNLLLDAGKGYEAERHYREALRLAPVLARAKVNLGNILARRGRFGEAEALYLSALKEDPRLAEARVNLSAVRRARGRD